MPGCSGRLCRSKAWGETFKHAGELCYYKALFHTSQVLQYSVQPPWQTRLNVTWGPMSGEWQPKENPTAHARIQSNRLLTPNCVSIIQRK